MRVKNIVSTESDRSLPWAGGYRLADLTLLLLGCGLLFFMGWRWNNPLAAWLAPVLLIRFVRGQPSTLAALVVLPAMFAPLWFGIHGLWHLGWKLELLNAGFRALPFVVALYLDRWTAQRLEGGLREFVYPSAFVIVDWFMTLLPAAGSVFSPAATQFSITPLVQLSSLTGIWGISFLIGWFATVVNRLWEEGFDPRAVRVRIVAFLLVVAFVIAYGGLRMVWLRSVEPTVRIGSVAVGFDNPYWKQVGTRDPVKARADNAPEFTRVVERLYADSERLVAQGARIVMWGEANAPLYADQEKAFLERAREFARRHGIYFLPGLIVLHQDEAWGENKVVFIDPTGNILFSYEKTKTPKKTRSDGVLPYADTPYGRISASICFDMDYPVFANQLGRKDIDIMLVPSWDNDKIKPFHSEVGAFRAVENGFSSVRNVVRGSSMTVDYLGNVLAYQDFFTVDDATLLSDVPVKGTRTLYGMLGNWLVYMCAIVLLVGLRLAVRGRNVI